jgi:hypothetical protein
VVAVVAGLAFGWMKTTEPYRLQRAMTAITKLGGTYKTEDVGGTSSLGQPQQVRLL